MDSSIIDIKKIFFGYSDGKNEAKENIFLDTFFDYGNIYSQLHTGKYLILGSKGSGKTLLIEYFKKKRALEGDLFVDIRLEEFLKKKEQILKEDGLYDVESLLKWIIYIDLSKMLLTTDSIEKNKYLKNIEKFMNKNKFDLNLDTDKILETIIEKGFKNELSWKRIFSFDFLNELKKHNKNKVGDYYNYISELEKSCISAIKNINFKNCIYIIFDELDIIAKKTNNSLEVLSKLVDLFHTLNTKWQENNIPIRLIISLRSDVYRKLDSINSGKIKEDYGLLLDWGKQMDLKSPLFKLIFHKIRYSDPTLKNLSDNQIWRSLFGCFKISIHHKKISLTRYILSKTLLRPRDIVAFFRKLQEQIPTGEKIDENSIKAILKDYSSYLSLEMFNEACIFLTSDEFLEALELLKNMRMTIFSYDDITSYLKENKNSYTKITLKNLEQILKILFEIGLLGNLKSINGSSNNVLYFKYKDDCEMNKKEKFSIHFGIRHHLNLSLD